jgi:hypothetical protein
MIGLFLEVCGSNEALNHVKRLSLIYLHVLCILLCTMLSFRVPHGVPDLCRITNNFKLRLPRSDDGTFASKLERT